MIGHLSQTLKQCYVYILNACLNEHCFNNTLESACNVRGSVYILKMRNKAKDIHNTILIRPNGLKPAHHIAYSSIERTHFLIITMAYEVLVRCDLDFVK